MIGWTCPSCGVNYAPSVTECRCSVVTDDWIEQMRKITETPPVYGPVTPWIDPWTPPRYPFMMLSADTGDEPARSVATTWIVRPDGAHRRIDVDFASLPSVDLSNVDYLQLASLGGPQYSDIVGAAVPAAVYGGDDVPLS